MVTKRSEREDLVPYMREAKKWIWITIAYLIFDALLLFLVMQNSQAMKANWMEDLLYFIPSISFLVAANLSTRPPNKKFRYGYSRAYSVGFIISSIALMTIGGFIFFESLLKLINHKIITIGTFSALGETFWFGWIMIAVVGYSIIPVYLLGAKKLQLAKKLNIQILHTDAKGQKADWLTSVATIVGITGIGFGIWWADAAAALIIGVDVISDGVKSFKAAITEAMDRTPLDAQIKNEDPLVGEIEKIVEEEAWVKDSLVRIRSAGNKTTGEILVIAKSTDQLQDRLLKLREKIENYHWEITEIVVAPVKQLPELWDKKM